MSPNLLLLGCMFVCFKAFCIGLAKGFLGTLRLTRSGACIAQEQGIEEVLVPGQVGFALPTSCAKYVTTVSTTVSFATVILNVTKIATCSTHCSSKSMLKLENPPTPADGKGERVRAERLCNNNNNNNNNNSKRSQESKMSCFLGFQK